MSPLRKSMARIEHVKVHEVTNRQQRAALSDVVFYIYKWKLRDFKNIPIEYRLC